MNFTNIKEIEFPEVTETVVCHSQRQRYLCPEYKAIINPKTKRTYYIASQKYKLVKHEEVLTAFDDIVSKMPEFGKAKKEIDFFNDGGIMDCKYTFNDLEYKIKKGDIINPTITARNSYDGTNKQSTMFGAFRLICSNGMVIGDLFAEYKKKHMETLDLDQMKFIITEGMEKYSEQTEIWKSWLDRKTTSKEIEDGLGIFCRRDKLEILKEKEEGSKLSINDAVEISEEEQDGDLPSLFKVINMKKTLSFWIYFNILTQFISHKVKSRNKQMSLQRKLSDII